MRPSRSRLRGVVCARPGIATAGRMAEPHHDSAGNAGDAFGAGVKPAILGVSAGMLAGWPVVVPVKGIEPSTFPITRTLRHLSNMSDCTKASIGTCRPIASFARPITQELHGKLVFFVRFGARQFAGSPDIDDHLVKVGLEGEVLNDTELRTLLPPFFLAESADMRPALAKTSYSLNLRKSSSFAAHSAMVTTPRRSARPSAKSRY